MSGLRRALIGLAVAAFALGLAALALVTGADRQDADPTAWVVLAAALGWGFSFAGIYAWWRRPDNRSGALMTLVGFLWFLGSLTSADTAWVYTLGLLLTALWVGGLVHMLVAFPTGRVEPGFERGVVILGWATAALTPLLSTLVTARPNDCSDCPPNRLLVWDSDGAVTAVNVLTAAVEVVLLVALGMVLIRHWRAFGMVQRRALAPVLWTGAVVAVVGIATVISVGFEADSVSGVLSAVLMVAVAALPFAFLLGLLRSSLSRAGAVSALFDRLGGESARDALAEALGDDSLALAYWLPESHRYVDAHGVTVALPSDGGRAVTVIEREGAPVAAIVHDPALLDDRELVRTAGAAAALALQNERLAAEVQARYDDLRAASERLVAASDAARRRIERDLHDGAQQRLVSLSVTLNLARKHAEPGSRTETLLAGAVSELSAGLSELRDLARGIHPAVLTERGLHTALEALAARAPLPVSISGSLEERLPPAVESAAYFVVTEALTNVAKYASASTAEVTIEQVDGRVLIGIRDDGVGGADPAAGSGLAGLSDRVVALGGKLEVESPLGGGTRVVAHLPTRGRVTVKGDAFS
jgi:signal transduction histidine kinase